MAENGALRTETFPVGVVGVGLAEETRQIPAGEPPPLPPNAELAVVGKPYPRVNGRAKVTGAIRFTVDVAPSKLHKSRTLTRLSTLIEPAHDPISPEAAHAPFRPSQRS